MNNPIDFLCSESKLQELTFDMVEENQFFINCSGDLCQKVTNTAYNIIADRHGYPLCNHWATVAEGLRINKIIPRIEKIKF